MLYPVTNYELAALYIISVNVIVNKKDNYSTHTQAFYTHPPSV